MARVAFFRMVEGCDPEQYAVLDDRVVGAAVFRRRANSSVHRPAAQRSKPRRRVIAQCAQLSARAGQPRARPRWSARQIPTHLSLPTLRNPEIKLISRSAPGKCRRRKETSNDDAYDRISR